MAYKVTGPLRLVEYRDGKPVFAPQTGTPVQPTAGEEPPAPRGPANLYPGTCTACGGWVAEKQGERSREGGRWVVRHHDGECPQQQPEARPEPEQVRAPEPGKPMAAPCQGPICTPDRQEPWDGYFTAQFGDDSDDYITLRIRRQAKNARFKPGRLIVARLTGPENTTDYTSVGDIDAEGRCWLWKSFRDDQRLRQAIASVLGDQRTAGEAWARVSEHCWKCGQPLTTPESLELLVGPECRKKIGI